MFLILKAYSSTMSGRLKRRSSVMMMKQASSSSENTFNETINSSYHSVQEEMEDIDEQEEIRERKERHKKLRKSLGPGAETPTVSAVSGYSAAQLAQHYSDCIKLSAENKINAKNAFTLNMIDFMTEMLKKKQRSQLDNFQAASCALDASTKIYAYRVDRVHTETLKLASGVGSSKNEHVEGQEGQEGQGDEEGGAVKKKKRRKAKTVETNLANITLSKFDLEFDIDPLFKKVSQQFDSGGSGGQFLSTLRMRDDSGELVLDSNAQLESVRKTDFDESRVNLDVKSLLGNFQDRSLTCGVLSNFSFKNWSVDDEEKEEANQNIPMNQEHAFDADAVEPQMDDDAGGFFDDDYGGADGLDEDQKSPMETGGMTMALMDVNKLRDHLAAVPNEYSYFDTGKLGAWAGPGHWKFKPVARKVPNLGERKKTQRKEKEKLDFEALDNKDSLLLDFVQKAMSMPKRPIKLQNKTIDSWTEEKNLIPDDIQYSGKDFVHLEFQETTNVAPRMNDDQTGGGESVDDTVGGIGKLVENE